MKTLLVTTAEKGIWNGMKCLLVIRASSVSVDKYVILVFFLTDS